MEHLGTTRKLAAILIADVVGYSRLAATDEQGALAGLMKHREELIDPGIASFDGRVVKSTGDGVLVEFPSAVGAVQCAADIQRCMVDRNSEIPEDQRIIFRVGINLGDVIAEDDDLHGNGVNVAARLEKLCTPGGVLISGTVFDQLEGKTDLGYEYLGEQQVKNIPTPIRTYQVLLESERAGEFVSESGKVRGFPKTLVVAAISIVLIIGSVLLAWQWQSTTTESKLELPAKPSIAVLPFTNISDDQKQDYFADGITEDLITDLSRLSALFVIARNSSFSFKGKQVKVQDVARELGVRYVLEGSVRRAGNQLRINAQLIDAQTSGHLWANRYDGPAESVFALQDKVTAQIVSALALTLTAQESRRLTHRQTNHPAAYDAFLQGRTHFREFTEKDSAKAEEHFLRAIEIDPNYGQAHAGLAAVYWNSILRAWRSRLGWHNAHDRARRHLAIAMKNPTPLAHRIHSRMLMHDRKHDAAIAAVERAIALDPNDADSFSLLGHQLIMVGMPKAGADAVRKAMRLDPFYPALYLQRLGYASYGMEDYIGAIAFFERARKRNPELSAWMLFAAYGQLGQKQKAEKALAEYLEYRGWRTWRQVKHILPYFPYKKPADLERFARGMVKAGLCCEDHIKIQPSGLRDLQK